MNRQRIDPDRINVASVDMETVTRTGWGHSEAKPEQQLAQETFVQIRQGHRVFYREAHILLEELADAQLAGTRSAVSKNLTDQHLEM